MYERLKLYYSLTKPGVLYGNAFTAAAGFLFASRGYIDWHLFLSVILGTSLIIGSACVINNYLDRDIDKIMLRTQNRALVKGDINPTNGLLFGMVIGILGIILLILTTNILVVVSGFFGFIVYVLFYGALSKRRSIHGTLVGSVSGAIPIFAGYVAVSNNIDMGALLLFMVLFFWQLPEFYAISIYRQKEYKAAGVPVISVIKGIEYTKRFLLLYTLVTLVAIYALFGAAYTGYTYFLIMLFLGIYWVFLAIKGLITKSNDAWARRMFKFSLVVLLMFSILLSLEAYLP